MISITVNDETSGTYRVNTDDIPELHKSGEWWKDEDTIYLDQTHKYQTELFHAIEEALEGQNDR